MKIPFTILACFFCSSVLKAQPGMDFYFPSIRIIWKADSRPETGIFLRDSLEYGFFGFYESSNFKADEVALFLNGQFDCSRTDPMARFDSLSFPSPYFCDTIQKIKHHNPTVGFVTTHIGNNVKVQDTRISYVGYSAERFSENDFVLLLAIRRVSTGKTKAIVIRDKEGPLRYHLTIELDAYDYASMDDVYFTDFLDIGSSYYSDHSLEKSSGNWIMHTMGHASSLAEIETMLHSAENK